MRQRIRELDFLRAIAALSVVMIHTTSMYVLNSRTSYLINQGARFSVPLFIVLSGFLLFNSDEGREQVNYTGFLIKRVRKIFIPYVIWTLIYVLYDRRHFLSDIYLYKASFLKDLARDFLLGSGYSHLYFIVIIMQLYIIYPLIRRLLKRYPTAVLSGSLALTLYLQTASWLIQMKKPLLPVFGAGYLYLAFPSWLFYFVFGMYIAAGKNRQSQLEAGLNLFGVLWPASLALLLYEGISTDTYGSSLKPTVILYCLSTFAFFFPLLRKFSSTAPKWGGLLEWISAQSFLIYFSHLILFRLFDSAQYIAGINFSWTGTAGMVIQSLVTVSLSILFSYVVSFLPFASVLGGVHIKRRAGDIHKDTGVMN